MKNIKSIIIFLLSMLFFSGITVFATSNILGLEIFYDNKDTILTSDNVQNAVDELYDRFVSDTCYTNNKTRYTESILNGADPVLGQNMIPVIIDKNGKITYANVNSPWYEYSEKKWANAVMLVDSPSKTYKECEEISNDDIKAYFVWIPRYKYKIWNTGNYTSAYQYSDLTDDSTNSDSSLRNITNSARAIDVVFESKSIVASTGTTVGTYLTHPAFTSFNVNGLWVGKFEMTGNIGSPTIKPSETSLKNQTIGVFWNTLYNFSRANDSHMMKNTEWGAAAYLSHSLYGIDGAISLNNNTNYLTGYGAADNLDQSSYYGTHGTTSNLTQPWNTLNGVVASTTGNITGIYDMAGGSAEYVAAYLMGYGAKTSGNVESGFTSDPATLKGAKYFDVYSNVSNAIYGYNNRKLGDATGEMGPFYAYYDKDGSKRYHNSWYGDSSYFISVASPWFSRGGVYIDGSIAGQFTFVNYSGTTVSYIGTRLVLAPN